jgi:acetylornithine deacetylase/succinyl-diaminopimelate desuccinylase-like protein
MASPLGQVEARREALVGVCRQLVQIRTVNPLGENYADLCNHLLRAAMAHAAIYGQEPKVAISPGFNDAHYLTRDLGIPCITYGPGITGTAHAPDEHIAIDDLVKATAVLTTVAQELLR